MKYPHEKQKYTGNQRDDQNVESSLSLNTKNETEDENISKINEKIEMSIKEISKKIESFLAHLHVHKQEKHTETKWKFAASVLDRLFFLISLAYFILITISTILVNKNFWNFS